MSSTTPSVTPELMDRKVRELERQFRGMDLDRGVLESVLEMCEWDVRQATTFLAVPTGTGGDESYYVERSASSGPSLPPGYMDRPCGFKLPSAAAPPGKSHPALLLKAALLCGETSLSEHMRLLRDQRNYYVGTSVLLLHHRVDFSSQTKARMLAACWAAKEWAFADHLLSHDSAFALPEVLKALRILDAPRRCRALEKRIARLEAQGTAKPRTIGLVRSKLNDLRKDVPNVDSQRTSVTGALAKRIRATWLSTFDAEKLEFFALALPKEPWRELADLLHCKPGDFALDWFLPVAFGAEPPAHSLVARCSALNSETALDVVRSAHVPYSFLRKACAELSDEVKAEVASYSPLDTLIWWYEELGGTPAVDSTITKRLEAGEEPGFGYGKLMERLLFFKMERAPFYELLVPIAEKRLGDYRLPLEPPVEVHGDASYSMDVAIRTATIIGSLLAALSRADLRFFNVRSFAPERTPATAAGVLDVALNTRADGLTAPACALWDAYTSKRVVRFFIVVTDEIENERSEGSFFAQLFYKYHREVHPAQVVFVSFLDNPREKGRMVQALENLGITPLQFRLDATRPDLTKLDALLGILASECTYFTIQAEALAAQAAATEKKDKASAMQDVLQKLADLPMPEAYGKHRDEAASSALLSSTTTQDDDDGGKGKKMAAAAAHHDEYVPDHHEV